MNILSLPSEIIHQIFDKLSRNLSDVSRAARTCKFLYDFLPRFLLQTPRYLGSFLNGALHNRRIAAALSPLKAFSYPGTPLDLRLCLREPQDIDDFKQLAEKFPSLTSLAVSWKKKELFTAALPLFANRTLSHLCLEGALAMHDLQAAVQNALQLQSLDLCKATCDAPCILRSNSLLWVRVDPTRFGYSVDIYEQAFQNCPNLDFIQLSHDGVAEKNLHRGSHNFNQVLTSFKIEAMQKKFPVLHAYGSFLKLALRSIISTIRGYL